MLITKTSKGLKILSPAKINLFLDVLNKRNDGYHEIESVMQTISLFDTIHLYSIKKGIKVSANHPELSAGPENLAYKAADLLKKEFCIKKGIGITIDKKIPVGGGLGGGSSNAAAVLSGLNHLWRLGLSREKLSQLGAQLGSDVPFFIYGRTALVLGRGEIVLPMETSQKYQYLLLTPPVSIPTKNIYKNINMPLAKQHRSRIWPIINKLNKHQANEKEIRGLLYNKLESVALKLYPVLKCAYAAFSKLSSQKILLSGSGSTIFTICANRKWAEKTSAILSKNKLGLTFIANTLD